jgi:hypothetical protein
VSCAHPDDRLKTLHEILIDLLRSIDEDATWMDANANDTHNLVEEIRRSVRQWVFRPGDSLTVMCQPICPAFERARAAENDVYEIYADDLERYHKRRGKDLSVAESDLDRLTLVRRRRAYITTLRVLQAHISAMLPPCADDAAASR